MAKACSLIVGLCSLSSCLILVCNASNKIGEVNVIMKEISELDNEHNITGLEEKHFPFYNSTQIVDEDRANSYWASFKNLEISDMLPKSGKHILTVQLKFDFPFYGQPVRNLTVADGGFLYTGDYVHSWLAATQYVAPLMADFDTRISNSSFVRFHDNGTAFTVLWDRVQLHDEVDVVPFTFSVTLHETGVIVFAYHSIPMRIHLIKNGNRPVVIGLSDAYILNRTISESSPYRRLTIFEYDRISYDTAAISNNAIITLTPIPTCHGLTDCEQCVNFDATTFKCYWCPILRRCSTGKDRKRQEWSQNGCDEVQISEASSCPAK